MYCHEEIARVFSGEPSTSNTVLTGERVVRCHECEHGNDCVRRTELIDPINGFCSDGV